jgi:hypothetical protein
VRYEKINKKRCFIFLNVKRLHFCAQKLALACTAAKGTSGFCLALVTRNASVDWACSPQFGKFVGHFGNPTSPDFSSLRRYRILKHTTGILKIVFQRLDSPKAFFFVFLLHWLGGYVSLLESATESFLTRTGRAGGFGDHRRGFGHALSLLTPFFFFSSMFFQSPFQTLAHSTGFFLGSGQLSTQAQHVCFCFGQVTPRTFHVGFHILC